MKKEVITAIFAGIILGVIVTYGVYTAQKSLREHVSKSAVDNPRSQGAETNLSANHSVIVSTPTNYTVVTNDSVTITGSTSPDATVAVITETESATTIADNQGNFSTKISPEGGPNVVKIYSFNQTSEVASSVLHFVYSTAMQNEESSEVTNTDNQ